MPETTQTPEPGSAAAPTWERGSEDEAVAAFAAKLGSDEQPEDDAPEQDDEDPKPADEAATDDAEEADEADPGGDEQDADELVEVELAGKTYKVPAEVEKAILRQSDYSRKMNEVGTKERELTARMEQAEQLLEAAEKRSEALAEVRSIDARIAQYDGIDWARIREENPNQAALAAVELLALKDRRKEAAQAAANIAREITQTRNAGFEKARDEMDAVLKKSLKGWNDELGTKVTQYALQSNVQLKTLQQITDPGLVIALDKARRYDELQAQKSTLKAKAQNAPKVAKPGAPRPVSDAKTDAMAKLRRERSQEAAEAAFLSRMR